MIFVIIMITTILARGMHTMSSARGPHDHRRWQQVANRWQHVANRWQTGGNRRLKGGNRWQTGGNRLVLPFG
jgi:hypothetical protein